MPHAQIKRKAGLESNPAGLAVRIRGLTKHFGAGDQRVQALGGIDLDIDAGEMSLIVGPSGCGKTTLLSVIAGILDAESGEVSIFGKDITRMSDRAKTRFRARNIGFVFQQYNLLPALSAAENAAIPLVIAGWSKAPAVRRAGEVLSTIGMGTKLKSLPSQLSGGQMQRVAIARALVHDPKLLVCDEPTAALDHETGITVMQLLRESAVGPDRAVVVVTHDNRVFQFGDRIAHMDDGVVVEVEDRRGEAA
jgi:putative ABC transport system ATP-binding protein